MTKRNRAKAFRELRFSDDFMFCKVMSSDMALCREVIEVCLGQKIGCLQNLRAQEVRKAVSDGRGVRLDIYADDNENRGIDVEMQKKNSNNIPERSRYYLRMMDTRTLKTGDDLRKLKDAYVIFITQFNIFPEKGLHRYTLRTRILEDCSLEWDDRQTILILCTQADQDDVSGDLLALLEYIRTDIPCSELTQKIENAVEEAKMNEEWEDEYSIYADRIFDAIEEGRMEERANTERERLRAEAAEKKLAELEKRLRELEKN